MTMKSFFSNSHDFIKTSRFLILGMITLFSIIGVANAAPVTFFGVDTGLLPPPSIPSGGAADTARSNFLGNLVGVGTENFETIPTNTTPPLSINFSGVGMASLSGTGIIRGNSGVGRFPTSGTQYLEMSGTFTITFSQPVAAFGFFWYGHRGF